MAEAIEPKHLKPGAVLALFLALFVVVALPVLWVNLPPLVDYPNHLARMHILADREESQWLQRYYEIHWRALPNLAMDLTVPALARIMPMEMAGKGFLLAIFLLMAGGPMVLHRVLFGRWSAWPCLAFLLLYNRVFLWGFVNYLFGLGLAFWALAGWVALRDRRAWRLIVAALFSLALFFCHLLAFGLWCVMAAGFELGALLSERRLWSFRGLGALLLAALPFLPPLAIMALTATPGAGADIAFGNPLRKFDLPFSLFDNYSRPFDVVCFAAVVLLFIGIALKGGIGIERRMRAPLLLVLLVYLVMPSRLMTATGADHRIPLALALLFLGSIEVRLADGQRKALAMVLGGLFLVRMAVIGGVWVADDRGYAPLLAALDDIPEGACVAVAFPSAAIHADVMPVLHFPTLAILRRDAFVPTLFTYAAQQPVSLKATVRRVAEKTTPGALWSVFVTGGGGRADAALEPFDYLIFVDRSPFVVAPSPLLQPVFKGEGMQLFKIAK